MGQISNEVQSKSFGREGLTFEYLRYASSPSTDQTVILLHGFPQDLKTWEPIAQSLAKKYIVLVLAQRGYSSTSSPKLWWSYTLPKLRSDVLALMQAENVEAAHLVGYDWGGTVGWGLARENGDRFLSFTAISTSDTRAFVGALFGRQIVRSWYMLLLQIPYLVEAIARYRQGALLVRMLCTNGLPENIATRYVTAMTSDGRRPTGELNWYRAMLFDVPELFTRKKVTVPTRILWSKDDLAVDELTTKRTAKYAEGIVTTEVVSGFGHWLPELAPELVTAVIERQIDSVC